MNTSKSAPAEGRRFATADTIDLFEMLAIVSENRWLIAVVASVIVALGVCYALFATPVYRANTLIQVESGKGDGIASLLGPSAALLEVVSPASAEVQLLRSRLVVGQAVKNLALDVEAEPKYLPLLGRWLSQRATQASKPGFIGFQGFVSGNESIRVAEFETPEDFEEQRFVVRLLERGFELLSPDGASLAKGQVGARLDFTIDGQQGHLTLKSASGHPGAEFHLERRSTQRVTEQLQRALDIAEEGRQSGIVRVTLEGQDPKAIARTLNEIGTLYLRQNVQRKTGEADKSLDFLGTFLPQLRTQMEQGETRLNQFRNRNSTFDLGTEGKLVLEQSVKLQASLLDLQQKRKEMRTLYTPEHHSIRSLDEQMAGIEAELKGLGERVKSFPDLEQKLLRLTRDVKVNEELYLNLLNASQQLRLVKEGKLGNVRVVDSAIAPSEPIKPRRALVVAGGAAMGLLLGLALAFLRHLLRAGIREPADIEARTDLRVIACVPTSEAQREQSRAAERHASGPHVLALAAARDPAVESLRSLRATLQFAMLDASSNIVMVAGPTPGIGKSFTALNLAIVLGMAGKRVLLADADLRKGSLNACLGVDRERGLSDVLGGSIEFDDAVHRQLLQNVDFLSTGTLPSNPAELLSLPAAAELLQEAGERYDTVLIDSAPVLAASDAAILAPFAGVLLMVVRARVTSLAEIEESKRRLGDGGVEIAGVILNDVPLIQRSSGSGLRDRLEGYRYVDYRY